MSRTRKRNRKKQSEGLSFPAPLASLLVLGAIAGLSFLWLCGRCDDLGRRIQALERQKQDLERRIINEEFRWTNMKAPDKIERLLRTHGLVMEWPSEDRVIRIPASALRALDRSATAASPGHPQFAQYDNRVRHD